MLDKTLQESIPDSATGYEAEDYKKSSQDDHQTQQESAKQQQQLSEHQKQKDN